MRPGLHTYSLLVPEDGVGPARNIEFEAPDAARAFMLAQQLVPGRAAELREDDRSLGCIRHARQGFWVLSPNR